jgi:hypothetical protein
VVVALLTESLLGSPTVPDLPWFVVVSQKAVKVRWIVGLDGGEYVIVDLSVPSAMRSVST